MIAARYFDLVREMKDNTYNHRLRLVESARQRGIKPTARSAASRSHRGMMERMKRRLDALRGEVMFFGAPGFLP